MLEATWWLLSFFFWNSVCGLLPDWLVGSLFDAYFKTKQIFFYMFVDEMNNIRMQYIGSNFKLKNITGPVMRQNEFKISSVKLPLDIKSAVQKFNNAAMLHHVPQSRLNGGIRKITNLVVKAGKTKLTFIRAAARFLGIILLLASSSGVSLSYGIMCSSCFVSNTGGGGFYSYLAIVFAYEPGYMLHVGNDRRNSENGISPSPAIM